MNTSQIDIDRRRERRISLEKITLPFLATRDNHPLPFEYLLIDVSPSGAKFAISQSRANGNLLEKGMAINLHLSVVSEVSCFANGRVVWAKSVERANMQLCAVTLFQNSLKSPPFAISVENAGIKADMASIKSLPKYLAKTIQDCLLLRKEISIHLKDTTHEDNRYHVLANHENLNKLFDQLTVHCKKDGDIPKWLNLEELRALIVPELPAGSPVTMKLERKLYENYNTAVMISLLSQ